MLNIKNIADRADMIINGYAFERKADGIHVLNLNRPDKATVLGYVHYLGKSQYEWLL